MSNEKRHWIYTKLQSFYKSELYFQQLDIPFYLSTFKFCLDKSNNFSELEKNLEAYQINDSLRFLRKKEGNLYFLYPSLSFQAESLYKCWDEILAIQKKSGENLKKAIDFQRNRIFMDSNIDSSKEKIKAFFDIKRFCFGNKPNPNTQTTPILSTNIKFEEERQAFPISIDFKYEYNSFRHKVISECEKLTGKDDADNEFFKEFGLFKECEDVIFIQTDIKSFFHKLQPKQLAPFISKLHPNAKNLIKYLKLLHEKYKYKELPIGWVLSRFVANIVLQEFHKKCEKSLSENFKKSLSEKKKTDLENLLVEKNLINKIELKHKINYVDDFIFLLSIPENSISKSNKKQFEKKILEIFIEEANKILKSLINNNTELTFYSSKDKKAKCYIFNKETVTLLKTNFAFFETAENYFFEDSEIGARLDEILLPIDNDIVLNSDQQFYKNLKGLKKLIISNRSLKKKDFLDLLDQVQIKIKKTGSRYIKSVFSVLRLFILSELLEKQEIKKNKITNKIEKLFEICREHYNCSSEWIKFFSGYFNFLGSIDYEGIDNFIKLLKKAEKEMKLDDKMLLRLMRNEYIYKYIIATTDCKLKTKALGHIKKGVKKQMLLNLSCQRERSIHVLCEAIQNRNNKNKTLKPIDLSWFGMFLSRLIFKKIHFNIGWVFSTINKIEGRVEDRLLDYGLSDLAIYILPINNESNRDIFITKALQTLKTKDKDEKFWKMTKLLVTEQKKLLKYYEKNEKSRIESIINSFNKENDLIYRLIDPLFHLEQYKLSSYLLVNRLNTEGELIKYVLSATKLNLKNSQLAPWSVLPFTFQKTGIELSLILQKMFKQHMTIKELLKDLNNAIQNISPLKVEKLVSESFGVTKVDLNQLIENFTNKNIKDKPLKITIAPIEMDLNSYLEFKNGFKFKRDKIKLIDLRIKQAIYEAIDQNSSIVLFPELCLPRSYLNSYLSLVNRKDIILIGGLEYFTDIKKKAFNSTIISIPVQRSLNPGGRSFMSFEQIKNFPSAIEYKTLKDNKFQYKHGKGIFIFKSDFWGDFAILTCSDFLSLGLRWILQKEVQSVFIPAQNSDSTTYDHVTETCIRDLHCIAVVCNNPKKGSSHCYAPYYDKRQRQIFKKIGSSQPEYHTFEIDPINFKITQQEANPLTPFREKNGKGEFSEFKQLPPDWRKDW